MIAREIEKAECFTVIVVTCNRLPSPVNGAVVWESTEFNSVASYSCNEGFMLKEPASSHRMCLANGFWSGRPPLCVPAPTTASADQTQPKSTTATTSKTTRPTEPLGGTRDQAPSTSLRAKGSLHQQPTSSTPEMTSVPNSDDSTQSDANVYIIWAMIALLICLIILVIVLIIVVYMRKRKMTEFDSSAANTVENPVYSGGRGLLKVRAGE